MKTMMMAMAIGAALAGCASAPISDDERLALYRAHAGAPLREFRYVDRLGGWTALGKGALAVWTRPNEAYLLELAGPCNDLDFASAISLTHRMDRVAARFDDVVVLGGPNTIRLPCRIESIRALDVKAVRASEKQLREVKLEERASASGTL